MSIHRLDPAVPRTSRRRSELALLPIALAVVVLASVACTRSPEARLEEVRKLQSNGQMVESLPILIELIESGNRQGEILYRYGRALSLTGKPSRSVWALDAAREDPAWFVPASQQLALDAHRGGNYDFAIEIFKRLHEQAPEETEKDLTGLLLEARVLLESRNHFEEALELVDHILDEHPGEESAIRMKTVALLGLHKPDEAYEFLKNSGVSAPTVAGAETKTGDEAAADPVADPAAKAAAETSAKTADPAEPAEAERDGKKEGDEPEADLFARSDDVPDEAYWCAVRVSFKREAGELDEATKIADECLAKYPADPGLIGQSIKLDAQRHDYDRMLRTLEAAFKERPDDPVIRGAMVEYYLRLGRTADVERILRKAIDESKARGKDGTLAMAANWTALAGFLMEHDRVGEALLAFDAVNDIVGDKATPDLLLREAEALILAKHYDDALVLAEKSPVEVHRAMLRGRIAYERGEYQKAFDELGQAALLWPDNAPTRFYRARAAEGLGEFDVAIEEYRQAIRSDPTLGPAREQLARLHLAEGNVREAAAILTFQSPREPATPTVEAELLMVEIETRRGTEPDVAIEPTANYPLDKLRLETASALGRGLAKRANPRIAAGVLGELEKAQPVPLRGSFLREQVKLLLEAGEPESAVREARAGFDALPGDPDRAVALGLALVGAGQDLAQAEKILRGVVDQRPKDVDAWTALGDLHRLQKNFGEANTDYERALGLAPDHWAALSPLIENQFAAGDGAAALARLERYVAGDSPYDGRGALELARRLPDDERNRERRIRLARQAVRFGAGPDARELLAKLDPSSVPPPIVPMKAATPAASGVVAESAKTPVEAAVAEPKSAPAEQRPAVDVKGKEKG